MTVYACDQFRESVVSPICQRCGQYKRYHVDRPAETPGTGVKQANSPQTSQIPPVEEARARVLEANGQYKLAAFTQTVDDLIAAVRAEQQESSE